VTTVLCHGRKQRVVGDFHSINREIETVDHDNPLPGIRQPFAS
jgi:hypothetical protein